MTWYRTGTVSVENASTTVTGSLTAWLMAAKVGDAFVGPDDARYEITAVNSNTEIEIYPAYAGSTASGQSYAVERISTAWNSVSELSVSVAETAEAFQRGFAMQSTTEVEIGDGPHEFAVPSGLPILPGARLLFSSRANPDTHWILGLVTAYEGQTITLAEESFGSGEGDSRADWNINIAGLRGDTGPVGPEWVDWQGAWSAGAYTEGQGVQHDGSSYRANTTTSEEPPHADWDLIVSTTPFITLTEDDAPSTPASGKVALYAKDDHKLYTKDSDGTETEVGAGGVGAFTDLTDAPASYAGHGGKGVAVDAAAGGLEFVPRREVLTSNRTYYVRTDGNDANTGLENSSGGAFLTIQKAIDTVYSLDCSIYSPTISVQSGTYTAGATFAGPHLGGTNIVLSGSSATISTTNANCISVQSGAKVSISGFTLETATAGYCIECNRATVSIGANMSYGAAAGDFHAHLAALDGGLISIGASYSITGGAIRHLHVDRGGTINAGFSLTVTISGTPAFTTFAEASGESVITTSGNTYSGSATGKRFNVTTNSALNVFSGALTLFPGNVAGTVASGGVYGSYLNWESINKTTDESTASDTTFSSDSQLQFTMLANSTYHVRGRILFSTVDAADFKWQLTGPSAPTLVRIAHRAIGGGETTMSAIGVATAFSTSVAVLGSGAEGFVEFDAAIQNGANAGTFAFQWAQNTSDAGNTTVRAGSYLEFIRMT